MMSVNNPVGRHILIVSDNDDELGNIQHLLADDFGGCLKANNEAEGLQLFNEYKPRVLILAFNLVEEAEHFYLLLHQSNSQIYEIHHQTLLFCNSNESSKAYLLCKGGTFDDFVADRPIYEPYSLRLSVVQALKRQSHDKDSNRLNNKIEKISFGLRQLEEFISQQVISGDGQQQETTRKFHYFTQKLTADLGQLENNLLDNAPGVVLQTSDTQRLKHQFEQFLKISIQQESKQVVEQLGKAGNWLNELNNGYMEYVEKIQDKQPAVKITQVMLVDDDDFYRDTLSTLLEEAGMQVVGLDSGKAVLSELQHTQPDIILLDYIMPDIDGIETLKQIKLNPDTKFIPTIMLTGVHERKLVAESIREGAVDFIVKPSGRTAILKKIDDAITGQDKHI